MKRGKISENKKAPRDRSVKDPGLCGTCRNNPACAYVRPDEVAVIFCEEFDSAVRGRNPVRSDARSALQRINATAEYEKDALPVSRELCVNCTASGECIYPHSGGNRWYCEEYS